MFKLSWPASTVSCKWSAKSFLTKVKSLLRWRTAYTLTMLPRLWTWTGRTWRKTFHWGWVHTKCLFLQTANVLFSYSTTLSIAFLWKWVWVCPGSLKLLPSLWALVRSPAFTAKGYNWTHGFGSRELLLSSGTSDGALLLWQGGSLTIAFALEDLSLFFHSSHMKSFRKSNNMSTRFRNHFSNSTSIDLSEYHLYTHTLSLWGASVVAWLFNWDTLGFGV